MCNNGNLGMVYAGRSIAGLEIGQASVVAPIYVSKIPPKFHPNPFEDYAQRRSLGLCILASCWHILLVGAPGYIYLLLRQHGGYVYIFFPVGIFTRKAKLTVMNV